MKDKEIQHKAKTKLYQRTQAARQNGSSEKEKEKIANDTKWRKLNDKN